ncbi:hypothetical protein CTAYLR_008710 [Chrysophaeum taylorii]|uniref:Importin N-terminal domain-containing protein n=1 Tax=Chrysophaeum taylorii TaxID=2483200 RepID=A0AAD7UJB1_9STRA|nr:hypothetical protein CTAYLR_008710 [Chrysophaeum taylorii]
MEQQEICGALMATLSPEREQRRNAEAYLSKLQTQQGFAVLLLQLVQQHSATATAESAVVRTAAAIYFKNLVKRGWADDKLISVGDRDAIKANMVKLVCECGHHSDVQQQLSAALSIISASDFPAKWPNLLPELISQFESPDLKTVTGMLRSLDSILERFRDVEKSDALYAELKYVLDMAAAPLTKLFGRLGALLASESSTNNRRSVEAVVEALRLACRVFYSLNWQDLPEFFEDNMSQWMPQFEKYLALELPSDEDEEEGALERLQSAIVENVSLYASKYEEEFAPYLQRFASAIWNRLMKTSQAARHDQLTVTSIKFLASVVGNAVHAANFGDEQTLRQITEAIVVPNLQLREVDLELFEDNPMEYISRDFEDADSETRRRSAKELVQAMCKQHDALATRLCLERATRLLTNYAQTAAWRDKDSAMHLVVAIAVRAESRQRGVTQISPNVDVVNFFDSHVKPELAIDSKQQQQKNPVILADCLQFASTFRNQLPPHVVVSLVPILAAHARSSVRVVHTYAAAAIDRLLGTGKVSTADLQPHLTSLFEALFTVLEPEQQKNGKDASSQSSWENEYAMKAIVRLLIVAETAVTPAAQIVTDKLTAALGRVCANPRNPKFNHYLFESLAVLVRVVCSQKTDHADNFELLLFPPFQSVLHMDVVEFAPYVFQILALLLTFRGSLSAAYVSLLPPLANATLWERRGNVPALAQLLEAYFAVGAQTVVDQGQLEPILGVFQKLLASKQFEAYAFALVKAIVATVRAEYVEKYLPTIFQLLLTRLQQHRDRPSFVHHVVALCGLLAGQQSPQLLVAKLEQASQPGMLLQLAKHVFVPALLGAPAFNAYIDAKTTVVGFTRVLCETPDAVAEPAQDQTNAWVGLLAGLLAVVEANPPANHAPDPLGTLPEEDLNLDEAQLAGFDSAFSKLHFGTSTAAKDPFSSVPDLSSYVHTHVSQLVMAKPQPFQHLAHLAQQTAS